MPNAAEDVAQDRPCSLVERIEAGKTISDGAEDVCAKTEGTGF